MQPEEDEFTRKNIHDDLYELIDNEQLNSPTKKKVAFTETDKIKMSINMNKLQEFQEDEEGKEEVDESTTAKKKRKRNRKKKNKGQGDQESAQPAETELTRQFNPDMLGDGMARS